jgi:hypothetical protein
MPRVRFCSRPFTQEFQGSDGLEKKFARMTLVLPRPESSSGHNAGHLLNLMEIDPKSFTASLRLPPSRSLEYLLCLEQQQQTSVHNYIVQNYRRQRR